MNCEHSECERPAVGTVRYITNTERRYCQAHINENQRNNPSWIAEVTLDDV